MPTLVGWSTEDHLEVHHAQRQSGQPFLLSSFFWGLAHAQQNKFASGMAWGISEPHSEDETTFLIWLQHFRHQGGSLKMVQDQESWSLFCFVFLLLLLNLQPLSQLGYIPQETKCDFVLAGIWLRLGRFGRHWEPHASNEKEHQGGTNHAHHFGVFTRIPLLRCHLIGSHTQLKWEAKPGSSSKD